jgi:hypothetical protein
MLVLMYFLFIISGKSIQGVRKYCEMHIVSGDEDLQDLTRQRYFKNLKRIGDNVCLVQMTKKQVYLNRNIAAGQKILDDSRLLFYRLIFDEILVAYGRKMLHIHMSDTDSLVLRIIHNDCTDPYEPLRKIIHILDTSHFPVEHFLHVPRTGSELPGLLKIELNFPEQLERGYFMRAKLYLLIISLSKMIKKMKGTTSATAQAIEEKDFKSCLNERKIVRASQTTIRSINCQLFTICCNRIVMAPTEYKRWYKDKYNSFAYGDYRIKKYLPSN